MRCRDVSAGDARVAACFISRSPECVLRVLLRANVGRRLAFRAVLNAVTRGCLERSDRRLE